MKPSEVDKKDLKLTESLGKAQESYPTWDFVKSLKSAKLTKRNGTKVEYQITDKKDLLAFADARKRAMRQEMDAHQEHQAGQHRVKMRVGGHMREVPEHLEDRVASGGKATVVRSIKPTTIYRDGRWWVKQNGSWVPEE